jgi:hypothetical protein
MTRTSPAHCWKSPPQRLIRKLSTSFASFKKTTCEFETNTKIRTPLYHSIMCMHTYIYIYKVYNISSNIYYTYRCVSHWNQLVILTTATGALFASPTCIDARLAAPASTAPWPPRHRALGRRPPVAADRSGHLVVPRVMGERQLIGEGVENRGFKGLRILDHYWINLDVSVVIVGRSNLPKFFLCHVGSMMTI